MNLQRCFSLLILILAFALAGCPKVQKTEIPTYADAKKKVLSNGALVKKPIEEREAKLFKGGKAQGIKAGTAAPHTGVLINNKKAAELAAIKAERNRLRQELEAARLAKGTSKIIYEAAMERLKEEAQRTWWEKNRGTVGLSIGIIVGSSLVLGVLYAVTKGDGVTVNTAPMVLRKRAVVRW